jgi:hypothetical protein
MALMEILDDDNVPTRFQPRVFGNMELLPQEWFDFISFRTDKLKAPPSVNEPYLARIVATGKVCTEANGLQNDVVYDVHCPGPPNLKQFLISLPNLVHGSAVRPIRVAKLCWAVGFLEDDVELYAELYKDSHLRLWARKVPSSEIFQELMLELLRVEGSKVEEDILEITSMESDDFEEPYAWCQDRERFVGLLAQHLNWRTTIPLPTSEEWQAAVQNNPDLQKVLHTLANDELLVHAELSQKAYYDEWQHGSLEVENGVVYQYEEPKKAKVQQLCRKVVPLMLRRVIITAYHVAPMAGHVGFYKTYYWIASGAVLVAEHVVWHMIQCHWVLYLQVSEFYKPREPEDSDGFDMWSTIWCHDVRCVGARLCSRQVR